MPYSKSLPQRKHTPKTPRVSSIVFTYQSSALLLLSIRQRLSSLGADLQHPRDLIEQRLILDRRPALQQFDVVGGAVDLLRKLGLRQLESFLGPAVLDRFGDLSVELLRGNDIVGAVDLCEALAFNTRLR